MPPVVEQCGDSLAQRDPGPQIGWRTRQQDPIPAGGHRFGVSPQHLAEPTLDAVSLNRSAKATAHDHAHSPGFLTGSLPNAEQRERAF